RTAELFDPQTNHFRAAGGLAAAQRAATAVVGVDGRVYLVGGSCGDAAFGMEIFDPKSGVWAAGKPPSVPAISAAGARLGDGWILLAGGSGPRTDALAVAEIWSPEAGWTRAADMRTPRLHATATVMEDGRVLLAGGELAKLSPTTSVEIYDPR